MSRLATLFVILTFMGGVSTAYLWQQLHAERELTPRLQMPGLPESQRQQLTNLSSASEVAVAPQTSAVSPPGQIPSSGSVAGTASQPFQEDRLAVLMPTLQKYLRDRNRAVNRAEYAAYFPGLAGELGLTEAEADAYYAITSKHRDEMSATTYTGTNEAFRKEAEYARSELERMHSAELQALLGPTKYRSLQEYLPTLEARLNVQELRSWVAETQPLTDSQVKQLTTSAVGALQRAKDETKPRHVTPPGVTPTSLQVAEIDLSSSEAFTRYVLEDARQYLTSQQHAAMSTAANQYLAGTRRNLEAAQRREASKSKP